MPAGGGIFGSALAATGLMAAARGSEDYVAERILGRARLIIVALCGLGVAGGAWLALPLGNQAEDTKSKSANQLSDDRSPASNNPNLDGMPKKAAIAVPAPDYHIEEGGRLSIDAASLRSGDVLTLGLALAGAARGNEPLPVVIASLADGRRLEARTSLVDDESGVRLRIDPDWLKPGRYMIQIKTAEHSALPLRRYVLEVTRDVK